MTLHVLEVHSPEAHHVGLMQVAPSESFSLHLFWKQLQLQHVLRGRDGRQVLLVLGSRNQPHSGHSTQLPVQCLLSLPKERRGPRLDVV